MDIENIMTKPTREELKKAAKHCLKIEESVKDSYVRNDIMVPVARALLDALEREEKLLEIIKNVKDNYRLWPDEMQAYIDAAIKAIEEGRG